MDIINYSKIKKVEADLAAHKEDYMQFKNDSTLESAKIEKELNDYKATLAGMNPNQEPKQKVNGYGIVSLPKNAANGQVSGVSIGGETRTNLAKNSDMDMDSNGDGGADEFELDIVNSDNADVVFEVTDEGQQIEVYNVIGINYRGIRQYIPVTENMENISVSVEHKAEIQDAGNITFWWSFHDKDGNIITEKVNHYYDFSSNFKTYKMEGLEIPEGAVSFRMRLLVRTNEGDEATAVFRNLLVEYAENLENKHYISSTKSTVSAIRLTSKNEDETEQSTQYITAKDEEGNIAELRSLPNGTKDEINVTDRKLIKRIGEKSNIANGMVIDFADMAEGGTYYAWNDDGETEAGVKGDTLGIDATTLTYQLAEPVEIPIEVSGTLLSHPSGTVYIEPVVADAGVYADKIEVLHQDLPIKAIEKVSKVDFTTGVETELDIEDIVIAENKLSFTHPDLSDGDIVFFEYEYDREGTIPETEIEYYDSRYTIKDSVTDKFYKWNVTVADGVPSIELVEV